jgi:ceramide glucosyltransferase
MTSAFWIAALFIGIPTVIVASFPIHAWFVLRSSRRYRSPRPPRSVSILVPVRGVDEGQTQACRQLTAQRMDASREWLFCVEDELDPAIPALRDLAATDPQHIRVVITGSSGQRLGKLHNLIEGVAASSGEWIIMVDSDTIVPNADYLRAFTARLATPDVGLVTCFPAYRHATGIAAALLSGAINSDLLGQVWGGLRLANGSCMAIRRDVLAEIGGFAPQSSSLLMDVILARRVREAGYQVVMHHEPVEVPCRTVTFKAWWDQTHRWQVGMARVLSTPFYVWYCWMRTAFPVALLVLIFANGALAALATAALATRIATTLIMSQLFVRDRRQLGFLWLVPLLDIVTAFGCWYALFVNQVEWRGRSYRVLSGGLTVRVV